LDFNDEVELEVPLLDPDILRITDVAIHGEPIIDVSGKPEHNSTGKITADVLIYLTYLMSTQPPFCINNMDLFII